MNVLAFGFVPDYGKETFDVTVCVSWTHLIYCAMIEVILIGKCIYSQLVKAVLNRQKIIYMEVRDSTEKMNRLASKKNLNTVIETFQKTRNYALYDKFWYLQRNQRYSKLDYRDRGFTVDKWGNVLDTIMLNKRITRG